MASLSTIPLSSIPPYCGSKSTLNSASENYIGNQNENKNGGESSESNPSRSSKSPVFAVDPSINSKLSLYCGFSYLVEADAILIPTNESFTERGGIVGEIWKICGKDLERDVKKAEKVRLTARG